MFPKVDFKLEYNMAFYKKMCLSVLMAMMICLTQLSYALSDHAREVNDKDDKALREFLASKRSENVAEKKSNVIISGDVRMEYRHLRERVGGQEVYGCRHSRDDNGLPLSGNDFDIDANLWFNAEYCRAWAVANLQFDNSAGVDNDFDCLCDGLDDEDCRDKLHHFHGSGVCNKICLKRAYVGYTIYEDCGELDIEIGRRRLYDFFESDVQFLSRFDGMSLKYADTWESVSDWYIKVAGFVVDERVNQFAWATELAMFNICDSGFDMKYSFIDWNNHGRTRCDFLPHCKAKMLPFDRFNRAYNYAISQVLVNYNVDENVICIPTLLYAAALYNHDAKYASEPRNNTHKGFGYYTGILIGEVEKAGDWSLELEWQYLQRNAVPFDDQSGIGLNNALDGLCDSRFIGVGYQGWQVEFLYAITDNLTIDAIVEASTSNEHRSKKFKKEKEEAKLAGAEFEDCHPRHTYSKVELEVIYAF